MTAPADSQPNSVGISGNPASVGAGSPTPPTDPTLASDMTTPAVDPVVAEPVVPAMATSSAEPVTEPIAQPVTPIGAPVQPVVPETASTIPVASASPATDTLPPIPAEPVKEEAPKDDKADEKEDDEEEEDEQVVERVIVKEKGGGLGCFGLIRNLTCIVISIILLLIAAGVAIVIFKPAFITEPLKTFLNADYKPADVAEGTSVDSVKNYIDEVTNTTDGEVTFQITEDQLTTLVREKFDDNVDVRTGMEENKLQLFIDIAQQGEPLWLIIELSDSGDNLEFSRIGFGRINTPPQLRDFVKEQAFGLVGNVLKDFNFDNSESFAGNFVAGELREGVTIKNVKFAPDLMLVTVEL